jgi:hypothetical protein
MNTKPLVIIFFLFFLYLDSFSQNDSIINNKSINYGMLRTSTKYLDSNKIEPSKTYIVVTLSPSARTSITKFTYEEWIKLLCDTTTDWAANLCLYNIYRKEADFFSVWDTREKWIKLGNLRKNDISYWRNNLRRLLKEPFPDPPIGF